MGMRVHRFKQVQLPPEALARRLEEISRAVQGATVSRPERFYDKPFPEAVVAFRQYGERLLKGHTDDRAAVIQRIREWRADAELRLDGYSFQITRRGLEIDPVKYRQYMGLFDTATRAVRVLDRESVRPGSSPVSRYSGLREVKSLSRFVNSPFFEYLGLTEEPKLG
jgi:hypothetical protein